MTETENPPRHEPAVADAPSGQGGRGLGWRRLQTIAAGLTVVAFVIPMAIEGRVEGFLVAMAAPFVVGLVLVFVLPRFAAVFLGVLAVATFAGSAPYIGQALTHPESATDFVPQILFTLSLAIVAIAAVPAYREISRGRGGSRTPHALAVACAAVALIASAVSIAAAAGVDDVAAQPGDETVVTRDFAFAPGALSTEAGVISVHLANEDSTRHTFTIDGLTDLSVPPNSTQRASFEAAPGTYRLYCRPHPGMEGVLVVK